ncbi:MAG: DUF3800 domain-containing protein [Thermoguttaceae bacterium]|nr:DUF3800 domain-containing protein [Thermoguttaceae bacterium]
MSKTIIYNFTDECGLYQQKPNLSTLSSHPFYVRSNYIIEIEKYFELEKEINKIKKKYGISHDVEIKWSHYGSRRNMRNGIPHNLSANQIHDYIDDVVKKVCDFGNATLYYTFTDNNALISYPDKTKLIKMHLQNAFQRIEKESENNNGYGIIIADDMNSDNKTLKKAMYQLTTEGDRFTSYPNIHKSLLIDNSELSCGLQVADLLAGVFTATLKYVSSTEEQKKRFLFGYELFVNNIYKIIRYRYDKNIFINEIYKSGIKEIPSYVGNELAQRVCSLLYPLLNKKYVTVFYQ